MPIGSRAKDSRDQFVPRLVRGARGYPGAARGGTSRRDMRVGWLTKSASRPVRDRDKNVVNDPDRIPSPGSLLNRLRSTIVGAGCPDPSQSNAETTRRIRSFFHRMGALDSRNPGVCSQARSQACAAASPLHSQETVQTLRDQPRCPICLRCRFRCSSHVARVPIVSREQETPALPRLRS